MTTRADPTEWYLMLDLSPTFAFGRVHAGGLYQAAMASDIGFEYDVYAPEERRALRDRCAQGSADLLGHADALPHEPIVFFTQVAARGAVPTYHLAPVPIAPTAEAAAQAYLAQYRQSVLATTSGEFDEAVIERLRSCPSAGHARSMANGLRDFHLRRVLAVGLVPYLESLIDAGESVLHVRTRHVTDYTSWIGGRELRQWVRQRATLLASEDVLLEVRMPTLLSGADVESHPALVKIMAHVDPLRRSCSPTPSRA